MYELFEAVKLSGFNESEIKTIDLVIGELEASSSIDLSNELKDLIEMWKSKTEKNTKRLIGVLAKRLRQMKADLDLGGAGIVHLNTLLEICKMPNSKNKECKISLLIGLISLYKWCGLIGTNIICHIQYVMHANKRNDNFRKISEVN